MRKPIATVKPAEAFKILAAGMRNNPYKLALLRRIWVGQFSHTRSESCHTPAKITFNVPAMPPKASSPRR